MGGGRVKRLARIVVLAGALGLLRVDLASAAAPQPVFRSPDEAVAALVAALQKNDVTATGAILGPGSEKLVRSGDPVKDREEARRFLDSYAAHHALVADGTDRGMLRVGTNE